MKNSLAIARTVLIVFTAVTSLLCPQAAAQNTRIFTTAKTSASEPATGQIDWPYGSLGSWNGPVIIFISGGTPTDRNGWTVLANGTVWDKRSPFEELSGALVAKGMAVVRFDHPAVRDAKYGCRGTIERTGLSESNIRKRCLNTAVLSRVSVDRYVSSIENVILHALRLMPGAKKQLVLFGFSEGLYHATTILERRNIDPRAMISIGSPAQRLRDVARWQLTERPIETLPEFDENGDGVITNVEIRAGYQRGVGRFASNPDVWLRPHGEWKDGDVDDFRDDLAKEHTQLIAKLNSPNVKDSLTFVHHKSGIAVPDVTRSFWRMHFTSEVSPMESMTRHAVPGLFMWGDKDRQVPVSRQADLVALARERGAPLDIVRFPNRFHMLSAQTDTDWFEPTLASCIADTVDEFVSKWRRR